MITYNGRKILEVLGWYSSDTNVLLDLKVLQPEGYGRYYKDVSIKYVRFSSVHDLNQWELMTKAAKQKEAILLSPQYAIARLAVTAQFYEVFEMYVRDISNGFGVTNFRSKPDYKQVKEWAIAVGLNVHELEQDILDNYDDIGEEV